MAKPFRRRSSAKKEFTDMELKELRTAFELLDTNQDGRVSTTDLKFMLRKLGVDVDDEMLHELVQAASTAGSEVIDETEFLEWVKKIKHLRPEEEVVDDEDNQRTLTAAFKVFDLDGNGYITRDELKSAMETIGEPLTEQQLTEFIMVADTDKDGRINYEEFARQLL